MVEPEKKFNDIQLQGQQGVIVKNRYALSKHGKNLYALHFDHAPPPWEWAICEVWVTDTWREWLFISLSISKIFIRLVWNHWKHSWAPANVNFCVYRCFHLNFLEQLPFVEQYHAVNISSTWLDPECVIGHGLYPTAFFSYYDVYYDATSQQVVMS